MTTPLWCLVLASFIPYVFAVTGAYFRVQQLGKLDANHPRVQALQLEGIAARAYGAQANAWEALAVFTVAVLTAHLAGADPQGTSATLAIVWIVARLGHGAMYVADIPVARTLCFIVGWGCAIGLFYQAASA